MMEREAFPVAVLSTSCGSKLILPPPLPAGGDLLPRVPPVGVPFLFSCHGVPQSRTGTAPPPSLLHSAVPCPVPARVWIFSPA